MQILLLNYEKGWRGGERQTLLCLQQFQSLGHKVALLARYDSQLANAANDGGIQVYQAKNVWHICKIIFINRNKFQVMHAQTANTLTWLVLLKPFIKAKIAFTRRTAFPVKKRQWLTALKWRMVDRFFAISNAAANEPRRLGINVNKIIPSAVEPQTINHNNVQKLQQKYKTNGKKVIATAAAFTTEKDPLTLIKAIHLLRQERDDFVFIHFGASGEVMPQAIKLVQKLHLQQHYIFAGFRKDIIDCYQLMDVFVISSVQEALGSSVLDAFLYNVPVVATAVGGLKEVVSTERGLSCVAGDSNCLAKKINILLNDRNLRADLTKQAYNYVISNNSAVQMAQQYLKAYCT